MKSWDEYAALSDKTGRHPGNFMMLSDNERVQSEGESLLRRDNQKPDPTTIALIAPREAAKEEEFRPKNNTGSHFSESQTRFAANALLTGSRTGALRISRGAASALVPDSDRLLGENTGTESSIEVSDQTSDSIRRGLYGSKPDEMSPVTKHNVTNNPHSIRDAVWTDEEAPAPYTPRTTQERLDQDPLARARILRGRM
jgi:hypothetical protein